MIHTKMRIRFIKFIAIFAGLSMILSGFGVFSAPEIFYGQSLEEELQQWDTAIQSMLENQNIDPALVITHDEIPAVTAQVIGTLYRPVHFLGQGHPT